MMGPTFFPGSNKIHSFILICIHVNTFLDFEENAQINWIFEEQIWCETTCLNFFLHILKNKLSDTLKQNKQ